MSIQLVKVELEVPKEAKEIADLLFKVAELVMEKKSVPEYTALLPQLLSAVDGFDKVKEEVSSDYRDELAGYLVKGLLEKLLPAKK